MRLSRLAAIAWVLPLLLSACVTDSGVIGADAPIVREDYAVTGETTVVYTPAGWPEAESGDLYQPEGQGPFPAVVVIHGGGWDARDRSDMTSISKRLASRGYVALNIDYRLAPKWRYPAALEDTAEAVKWLRRNATHLHVDPARIATWGYSAGAHLAALVATSPPSPEARVEAVVAGGLPSDLPHYPKSPIITKFIGGTYAQMPATWIAASPARQVTAQTPPMFIYHGTWDRLVSVGDAKTMKRAFDAKGVPAELYLVHGSGHILTFLLGFGAERAGIDFLDRVLRRPARAH